ncbi:hypothetical protein CERSUDRAFT_124987 [Gelatoporia subvermispora B]|uniref:Uncharacterized protein n=1 Tax=Ceriporiopsis subvermispora (strain B) TaxID=914234 RepID=M2R8G8_CERS8|nr:hypothetical protein CERSUDRAFT_124987 [Gelatoporia subvermispora B]
MGSDRVEGTYLTLRSLGAPEISQDDFSRLCQGPLGEVLQFFADHVKGRQEVSRIRANIAQYELHCPPEHSIDTLPEPASFHLQQLLEEMWTYHTIEARENIRLQRFHALAVLLEKLRESHVGDLLASQFRNFPTVSRLFPGRQNSPGKSKSTRKSSPNPNKENPSSSPQALHAYSLALHQDSPQVDITQLETSENRLRQAVVKSLNTIREDSQMKVVYEECCRTARKRAVQGPRFISPLPTRNVNELELDDLSGRVTEKEQRLQAISDKTIELIEACERHLKEMEKFVEETIPQLQRLLEKAVDDTTGYVDILRLSITDRLKDAPQTEADKVIHCRGKSIAVVVTMCWQTPGKTVHDVKEALVRAHEIREFLRKAQLKDPSPSDKSTFSETQGRVDERITLLLSRKIEKARAAEVLVADIDRLADEVKMLCSSQTFLGYEITSRVFRYGRHLLRMQDHQYRGELSRILRTFLPDIRKMHPYENVHMFAEELPRPHVVPRVSDSVPEAFLHGFLL